MDIEQKNEYKDVNTEDGAGSLFVLLALYCSINVCRLHVFSRLFSRGYFLSLNLSMIAIGTPTYRLIIEHNLENISSLVFPNLERYNHTYFTLLILFFHMLIIFSCFSLCLSSFPFFQFYRKVLFVGTSQMFLYFTFSVFCQQFYLQL